MELLDNLKKLINSDEFKFIPVMAEKPYFGFPYMRSGGSYLKLFNIIFTLKVISKNLRRNQVAQIYLHPYEFLSLCSVSLKLNGVIVTTTATNIPQFDHLYNFNELIKLAFCAQVHSWKIRTPQ